jgi:hypothetical protein
MPSFSISSTLVAIRMEALGASLLRVSAMARFRRTCPKPSPSWE